VTEALALVVVAWIVYVSDALWWVKPERVILWGRTVGSLRAQFGPEYALRGDSGVFIPRLAPPFHINFEVDVTAPGRKAPAEDIVATARAATVAARPLTRLGILLWGYCFIVAPLLIVSMGLLRVWLPVLVGLFALAILVVASFARQWRALRPRDPGGWKGEALPMILSPLAAICAADNLTRSACAGFDGLAVVAALATRDDFIRIARFYYFAPREEAASAHIAGLDSILDPSLRAEILQAPSPMSEEMKGYCPRCHTQLLRDNGGCPECRQTEVIPFGLSMPSGASFDTSRLAARR
jgi:hypothetical protein